MEISAVREALHRQPFEPFLIRLADGPSLSVAHPDFVALGPRRVVIVGEDDSTTLIEPLLIASIDTLPPASRQGNGKHRG